MISIFLRLILSIFLTTTTMALAKSKLRPDCQEKCGNITIPYPFGIGPKCSANSNFTVVCNSSNPERAFLSSINLEVINISVFGVVVVNLPVSPLRNCSPGARETRDAATSLAGSSFTISSRYNSLVVLGCPNSVSLRDNATGRHSGCTTSCISAHRSTDTNCSGDANCCQATIPQARQLQQLQYNINTNNQGNQDSAVNNSSCGYVFPVETKWFNKDYTRYKGLLATPSKPFDPEFQYAPLVLEWEFRIIYSFDQRSRQGVESCIYTHNSEEIEYLSIYTYTSCCRRGFVGNAYIPGGCIDIDECSNSTLNTCPGRTSCVNKPGYYTCQSQLSRLKNAFIGIGSAFGALILLVASWISTKAIRRRIKASRRHKFFKRNGGLLLQQHLSTTDNNGVDKTMLFSSKELSQATDHYNENRVLGQGGQGTVYKGMLTDGRIVAVKKSMKVDDDDLEFFINEVVILSQVNHRNVVKLIGCCLETEVPLLVYEFVPNGTLFQHIHYPNDEFVLSWEVRLRIAREIAGALSYLHSAASAPIYHRDIKSTNILLDDRYKAKVSDFGTSRSVAIDKTHLTTRVLGTFGYLDPEYFQTSQFTDKSDVYSFGVVMVELLTGEKAITSVRDEGGKSLAVHFLHSMEENKLFEILDARVVKEGSKDEIVVVAELSRRCLSLNGKKRPTMKEVAVELEGIQMVKEGSVHPHDQDGKRENHVTVIDVVDHESYDFSTISGSMHFDTCAPFFANVHRPLLHEP